MCLVTLLTIKLFLFLVFSDMIGGLLLSPEELFEEAF